MRNPAWWEQFNDPVLTDRVQTALRENEELRIAAARIEEYLGRLETTRAPLFPQIGANAAAGRNRTTQRGPLQSSTSAHDPVQEAQSVVSSLQGIERALAAAASSSGTASTSGVTTGVPFQSSVPSTVTENPANSFQAGLNASWQLDLSGRIRRSTEAARANVLAAAEGVRLMTATRTNRCERQHGQSIW